MKRPMFFLLTLAALSAQPMSAAQVSGTPSGQNPQLVRQLENREGQLGERLARTPAPQGKGDSGRAIQRDRIRAQRQQIQDLLEKARSGQRIDPSEIPR